MLFVQYKKSCLRLALAWQMAARTAEGKKGIGGERGKEYGKVEVGEILKY